VFATERIRTRARDRFSNHEAGRTALTTALSPPFRVLLVEDDGDLRRLIAAELKRDRFEVLDCGNAREAVRQPVWSPAMSGDPWSIDVVLTDLRLGDIDGMALLQRIADAGVDVPVVLISGFGGPSVRARAARLGAAAFLDKPVAMPALLRLVRQLARERRRRVRTGGIPPTARRGWLRVVH